MRPKGGASPGQRTSAFMGLASIGIRPSAHGKVREILEAGDHLLIVATDRISAFDHVMPTGIPGRGVILTRIACFWLRGLSEVIPTHLVSDDAENLPRVLQPHMPVLAGRFMIVRKARRIDVECVVRGYLAGSGYAAYRETGEIHGVPLPPGLREYEQLPQPVFTPTTKADSGHDQPLTPAQLTDRLGRELAGELERLSLMVYTKGAAYAQRRGIVIADTKLEFGWIDDRLTLIDEVLTPDSSRFWPQESVRPGSQPVSLDKQFLRDYLTSTGWDRESDPPELPEEIVRLTRERYEMAERMLTGGAKRPGW
jgi:phosphoribosylaminoimidazole-succinocarboxamide synthase